MKAFDIAIKDLKQSFRNVSALVFMFGVPILMTTMFVFLFGGTGDSDEAFTMPIVAVQAVNLDQSEIGLGNVLTEILQGESLADLLNVKLNKDAEDARLAVDEQTANVAVIIPKDFTTALLASGDPAEVEIYSDPTLTLGPDLVTNIVNSSLDGFIENNINNQVVIEQLSISGLLADQEKIGLIVEEYRLKNAELHGEFQTVSVENTSGESQESSQIAGFIQMIMVAMMLFYAFYTGASTVQSVLTEEEKGTLPRLFTTPTPQRTILAGKFLASFLTVLIQMTVLLIFGALVFDFSWGPLVKLSLVVVSITITAASFGIFLISLLKNSKQAGVALGAGVTVTGMIGMAKVFTLSIPDPPQAVNYISRFVPQGWALEAIQTVMEGGSNQQLFLTIGVLLLWSLAFFLIGNRRFTRRYA